VGEELKDNKKPGRSFLLIVLVLGFLYFSLTGWWRLYLSIVDWKLLVSLGLFPGPLYLAVYGSIAGLFGATAAVSLWLRHPWAPGTARIGALAAAAWYWLDRLLFTRSEASRTNWPFWAGITLACLLFVFLVLAAPRQRKFFLSTQVRPEETAEESKVSHEQDQ
jgi:hypothetical protein